MDNQASYTSIPIPLASYRSSSSSHPVARIHGSSAAVCVDIRPQVLILDDCRFIAERLARAFEAKGYDATIAADGYAGLAMTQDRRFDLVVIDIELPFIGGFKFVSHLRLDPLHYDAQVLMLAAERSEADRLRAFEIGCSGYLIKSLQIGPLNAMIDSLADR